MPRNSPKRNSKLTDSDKALVAKVVLDSPGGVTPSQERGLALALRRTREKTKQLIQEAQEDFAGDAPDYVSMHKRATQEALADKQYDAALKGAQWAINHISLDGARLTEKEQSGPTGSRIMIGIKVGGVNQPNTAIDITPSEAE